MHFMIFGIKSGRGGPLLRRSWGFSGRPRNRSAWSKTWISSLALLNAWERTAAKLHAPTEAPTYSQLLPLQMKKLWRRGENVGQEARPQTGAAAYGGSLAISDKEKEARGNTVEAGRWMYRPSDCETVEKCKRAQPVLQEQTDIHGVSKGHVKHAHRLSLAAWLQRLSFGRLSKMQKHRVVTRKDERDAGIFWNGTGRFDLRATVFWLGTYHEVGTGWTAHVDVIGPLDRSLKLHCTSPHHNHM